jgi:predicted nuclease of predicted toxin-antitoxin system
MRFLVDNALSPALAALLRDAGHHASDVREIGLQHAEDDVIFDRAAADSCVLVSADTDFSTILATRSASSPSLILFRGDGSRKADHLASVIMANLSEVAAALDAGSIVTFEPSRVRVRALPIVDAED